MKNTVNSLALLSCLAWGVSLAHAGPGGDGYGQAHESYEKMMFKEMDTNGDGVISRAEFDAFYNRRFKQLDANGDGMITADEMRAAHDRMMENDEGRLEEHFRDADADHDGALSRDEAVNMPMLSRHFDDVDANKDGKVTLDELRDYIRKMHGNGDGRRGKPPKAE